MDKAECARGYAAGDEDVTDGSVENYGCDWGEPVEQPASCGRCAARRCGCPAADTVPAGRAGECYPILEE